MTDSVYILTYRWADRPTASEARELFDTLQEATMQMETYAQRERDTKHLDPTAILAMSIIRYDRSAIISTMEA